MQHLIRGWGERKAQTIKISTTSKPIRNNIQVISIMEDSATELGGSGHAGVRCASLIGASGQAELSR